MTSYEIFVEEQIQKDILNPPYQFQVWAKQFKTTVEKIARMIHEFDVLIVDGITYEYDDVTASIEPSLSLMGNYEV